MHSHWNYYKSNYVVSNRYVRRTIFNFYLFSLEEINLGDCLLKTKGAVLIGEALQDGHPNLKKVDLGFNEIGANGGILIASAMTNKPALETLNLNGNQVKLYEII